MPGHNAFQRNAFQRNAFQIVYSYTPTSTGGVVYGGGVTARFRHAGDHRPTSTGGIVYGGAVHARFTPGQVRRLGSPGRPIWTRIFKRPKRFRPRVSSGIVYGGGVRARFTSLPAPDILLPATSFRPASTGGVRYGGGVDADFTSLPPPPLVVKPKAPEPTSHFAKAAGSFRPVAGEVYARFTPAPVPEPVEVKEPFWLRAFRRDQAALKARIQEEDELILLDIL